MGILMLVPAINPSGVWVDGISSMGGAGCRGSPVNDMNAPFVSFGWYLNDSWLQLN